MIFSAILIKKDSAVSSLREAMIPLMNKKTCLSLSKYLLSSASEEKSLSLSIIWNARKKPAKNSWKLLCKNAQRVQGLRLEPPCWKEKNPKLIGLTISSFFSKYNSPLRRDSKAKLPNCKSCFLYTKIKSSSLLPSPFFFSYLLKTKKTISTYSSVLLVGRTPSKSSKRQHSKAVLSGFLVNSPNVSSGSPVEYSGSINRLINSSAKCSLPLKYFLIKLSASSLENPTISHRVSQYGLTFFPASWREVTTMWQAARSLLWTSE